ncbi:arginine decarboxylase [Friedmanniella luteola]|uniref:Pyruvoyl-dependent arginine decarboxylase AaxB n=1 Tax=Friedmanniella luteola TaxID=546871 RepID=A0A1H1XCR3_9ACTN|nr:pyruvoyl-dependent arginine decarboxylase [Friedmanniella luteola]SDT07103.1 arginine decarboxylase [Friedmanniella luteola]
MPSSQVQVSTPPAPDHRAGHPALTQLRIRMSSSRAEGPTRLAAFDAALVAAGLANFNLLPLSSVIPVGAAVDVVPPADQLKGRHGDLLYCVYAASYATTPGAQAWAGMAWALQTDGSGAGLFVEHSSTTEADLHAHLGATLGAMMENREQDYVEGGRLVASATCTAAPVAALVVASYQTAGWHPAPVPGAAR